MQFIKADWSVPEFVHALTTTRDGGVSEGNYHSFNLGTHVGDNPGHVSENRKRLTDALQLKTQPVWLNQVHGCEVVEATPENQLCDADASVTDVTEQVSIVLTADCLPVVFYNQDTGKIAAAHAGWRGLAKGILEQTVQRLGPGTIHAWMGPAIGPEAFEVGDEVRAAFVNQNSKNSAAFKAITGKTDKWLANIYLLAENRLVEHGVTQVSGGRYCTYSDEARFYSYRRNQKTGRMATLIWKSASG